MTEQDQTPRPDDDTMGHTRMRDADDVGGDDDTMGHTRMRDADDAGGDDDDDTEGHIHAR
jgi:hypothetical protein